MTAAQYAQALFELKPQKSHLMALREALVRRGHEKLLPTIFAEYQKLLLAQERRNKRSKVSAQQERTRVLLELYNALLHA